MDSHLMDDDCDDFDEIKRYQELRRKNLEDNQIMLKKLLLDTEHLNPLKRVQPQKRKRPYKPKRQFLEEPFIRRNPSRSSRRAPARFDLPRERCGSVSSTMSSSSSSTVSTPEKLVVRFGFFRSSNNNQLTDQDLADCSDDDDHDVTVVTRKPRSAPTTLSPEEVTQAHLDAVAVFVSDKKYDSINGTTCHQCRQKTDDMKTMCRSPECFGVRGQFCGPCLRNRYGDDAKLALKDPDWRCPPCQGICNCSFCRRKKGKSSTGILVHIAREMGFSDVNAYLASFKQSKSDD